MYARAPKLHTPIKIIYLLLLYFPYITYESIRMYKVSYYWKYLNITIGHFFPTPVLASNKHFSEVMNMCIITIAVDS